MASSNDLADLAALIKTERKSARRERRAAGAIARNDVDSDSRTNHPDTPIDVRFADYFRPWTEYKAPDDAERSLFRESVKDAVPLAAPIRADIQRVLPPPQARHTDADEIAALEASQIAMNPSPMSWDIGADIEDEQSYLRGGVSPDLLRKLRRGQWTIDAEIDLHHHTQHEAHEVLMEFMRIARIKAWRCVRIIHGKGLSSHQKIPVLRSKVRRWLQLKDEVLAFCEPRPHGGGSGAVLVLLRGNR